jgi:aldos-2-ulose dehydratase
VAVDITQNGLMDLVVCHDYGPHMLNVDPKGGIISWLENPGRKGLGNGHWKERFIGRWPGMHRLKAGFFTQKLSSVPLKLNSIN